MSKSTNFRSLIGGAVMAFFASTASAQSDGGVSLSLERSQGHGKVSHSAQLNSVGVCKDVAEKMAREFAKTVTQAFCITRDGEVHFGVSVQTDEFFSRHTRFDWKKII